MGRSSWATKIEISSLSCYRNVILTLDKNSKPDGITEWLYTGKWRTFFVHYLKNIFTKFHNGQSFLNIFPNRYGIGKMNQKNVVIPPLQNPGREKCSLANGLFGLGSHPKSLFRSASWPNRFPIDEWLPLRQLKGAPSLLGSRFISIVQWVLGTNRNSQRREERLAMSDCLANTLFGHGMGKQSLDDHNGTVENLWISAASTAFVLAVHFFMQNLL